LNRSKTKKGNRCCQTGDLRFVTIDSWYFHKAFD
jgi:hypothetical protein